MVNKYYNYKNIELWNEETWKDKYSPCCALFQFIEGKNNELFRTKPGEGPYAGRTDGEYNGKTYSYFYSDFIDRWKEKGLVFHSTEMGSVCWTAMIPQDIYDRKVREPKVLIVLCDADFTDPNWSVHTLLKYEHYNELAAKEGFVALYICTNGVNTANVPMFVIQEFSVIYNVLMNNLYIDVTTLKKTDSKLADIPGFYHTDDEGNKVADPDACIEEFYGIPALNISHRWQNHVSILMDIRSPWVQHPTFDPDAFVHSAAGRAMAEALRMEHDFIDGSEPEFRQYWEDLGLDFGTHDHKGFQWLSFAPKINLETKEKLPVVLIFQEVTYQDPHQIVSGVAAFKNYLELAATGELIALMFALESADDNDMFYDILLEASKEYPIDLSRVYVTGQSHNGYFTDEFVRRHHDKIAACAPLSNHLGIPMADVTTSNVKVPDSAIEHSATYDMPTVIVTSVAENRNTKLHCRDAAGDWTNAAIGYQRRLKANRCPMKTVEEINAVLESDNFVIRNIAYPVDRYDVQFVDGTECYIGEVQNVDGKYHLRFVVMNNQTHFIAPHMPELSWNFLRRFKRDLETGEVIELY